MDSLLFQLNELFECEKLNEAKALYGKCVNIVDKTGDKIFWSNS